MIRYGSTLGQILRGVAVFWLILLSCSTPAVAAITIPILVYVLIRYVRVGRAQRELHERLVAEVRMAQHAARMKGWG